MGRSESWKKNITQENAIKFLPRNVICHFGVSVQIITDNRTQFVRKQMRKFWKESSIKLSFALVHHSQTNKQVKVTNKSLVNILKKKIDDNSREWADLIPEVLWAYRTTIKNGIGQSPYNLTFGIEVVAPAKLVWPTTRILHFGQEENNSALIQNRNVLQY